MTNYLQRSQPELEIGVMSGEQEYHDTLWCLIVNILSMIKQIRSAQEWQGFPSSPKVQVGFHTYLGDNTLERITAIDSSASVPLLSHDQFG
jgi:hypothetical protein